MATENKTSTVIPMNEANSLKPKLRFKEFEGDWEERKLGELVNSISSGKVKPEKDGDFLVYGSTGVSGRSNHFTHEGEYLLIARVGANAGKINRVLGKYAVTDNTLIINSKKNILNNRFAESFLIKFNLNKLIFGSGQPLITGGLLKGIKINLPKLLEQQKIATFLTTVDTKLQQLNSKKSTLETYKKGTMQQLFSQKIRFKADDGANFSDWEEKKLGDIGNFKNGLNKNKKDFGFGSPFVNLMDVFGQCELNNQKFDLVNSNDKDKELYNLVKGDVLFIRSSVKRTGVGETVIIQEDLLNTVYSGFLIRFRDDQKSLYQNFKKYCFSSHYFRKELLSFATSSANTNINQESLNKINISFPSLKEQQKIATYLSAIDIKIESVHQQIKKTQAFKKGLLQQMFV